jgi:hypothetical protein
MRRGIKGVEGGRTPFRRRVEVVVVMAIKRTAGEERVGVVGEEGRTTKAWLVVARRRKCSGRSSGSSRHGRRVKCWCCLPFENARGPGSGTMARLEKRATCSVIG